MKNNMEIMSRGAGSASYGKLSFVIPAYNEQEYIGDCLRAILAWTQNKTFDTEIVVVNNASSDRTAEIARAFPGVKVVDEPRKGLSQARQTGFLACSGDLIANIDADTKLPEGWVERVFAEFGKNPKLVALSGPYVFYDLPKSENSVIRLHYFLGYLFYLINRFVLRIGSMLQGGNFVVKRRALEKIGGYNTAFKFYGEDVDMARRLNKVGDVKFSLSFTMPTSGRRLKAEGKFKMSVVYGLNYFWTIVFKKPFTKDFTSFREGKPLK
jgi:glycosyltransferase involved in cell wall biosynthesis